MQVPKAALSHPSELGLAGLYEIPAEDIRKYNEQLDVFYAAYEEYTLQLKRLHASRANTVRLDILAVNEGTCPAHDLDVFMHFPDGFALLMENGLPKDPPRPPPPPKPQTPAERMASAFQFPNLLSRAPYVNLPSSIPAPRNVSRPSIRRTKSYDVKVSITLLKHGFVEPLEPLYLMFESRESFRSFTIDYRIHASNLPDASEGQLHFIVDHSTAK
jgi:hypothetical protein